jgi:hypothetical protein
MAKSLGGEMILWINISNCFPDDFNYQKTLKPSQIRIIVIV